MTKIEVKEETAMRLQAIAAGMNIPLSEWLDRIAQVIPAPAANVQPKEEEFSPYELVEDLIGAVDSSAPDPDPDAKPRHTPFGQLLVEKFRKEGLNLP